MVRASKRNPLPNAPLELSDPITLPGGDVPGTELLAELDAEHAAPLFGVLHVVTAWAADGGASGWFAPDVLREMEEQVRTSSLDEHLRSAVAELIGEVADPGRADPTRLSRCCLQISEWALEQSAEGASLEFGRLAALSQPEDAFLAYRLGRRYRDAGRTIDAEHWLRRSAKIALWRSDWETCAHALTSLGVLAYRQERYPLARSYLSRALRIAERRGFRTLAGEIYHDRFTVAFITGEHAAVVRFARSALDRYLPSHPRLPALGYDLAYYWLTRGYAARALQVFRALLPHFHEPGERFQLLCASARAVGALGDGKAYRAIQQEATQVAPDRSRLEVTAALLDLGYGAAHVKEWEHAAVAFRRARDFAVLNNQDEDGQLATDALEAVRRHENPDPLRVRFFIVGEREALTTRDN